MPKLGSNPPVPSDYFGALWALAGIKNALILEHGATGTAFYNAVSFGAMNKQSPKGILFTTGLDEDDVVMGREEKIVRALGEMDARYRPELIALAATAVTSVIGLDLEGLIREVQPRINARLLAFTGGGFTGDYTAGIKDVFRRLVSEVAAEAPRQPLTVNLIGPTIDSFNIVSDEAEIRRMLGLLGLKVNTVFTRSTEVAEIRHLSAAALNVVTRDIGIEAAEKLAHRFGTPHYYGVPFGLKGSVAFLEQIAERLSLALDRSAVASELKTYGYTLPELSSVRHHFERLRVVVSCPFDYALGLTRMIREEWGLSVPAVVLPLPPEDEGAVATIQALGVETVWVAPEEEKFRTLVSEVRPHVLFGSAYDLRLAPEVPIRIHAAMPAFDHICMFDGTPFAGFRGSLHLTQTLINRLNACGEEMAF